MIYTDLKKLTLTLCHGASDNSVDYIGFWLPSSFVAQQAVHLSTNSFTELLINISYTFTRSNTPLQQLTMSLEECIKGWTTDIARRMKKFHNSLKANHLFLMQQNDFRSRPAFSL